MKPPSPAELRAMLAEQEGQGVLAAKHALSISLPGNKDIKIKLAARPLSGIEAHKEKLVGAAIAAGLLFVLWKVRS